MLQELLDLVYPREKTPKTAEDSRPEQARSTSAIAKSRRMEVRRVPKALVGSLLDPISNTGFRRMDRIERWKAAQILSQQ